MINDKNTMIVKYEFEGEQFTINLPYSVTDRTMKALRENGAKNVRQELAVTRAWLRGLPWRVATAQDMNGFAGAEHPVPLIAETDTHLALMDGERVEVYTTSFGAFYLIAEADNISKLP